MRLFLFKKFVGLGWHANATNDTPLMSELGAKRSHPLDLEAATNAAKQYDIAGAIPVFLAEFVVVSISFRRDIDDKRYIYLVPFHVIGDIAESIRPELTSMSGPLERSCTDDAYAME